MRKIIASLAVLLIMLTVSGCSSGTPTEDVSTTTVTTTSTVQTTEAYTTTSILTTSKTQPETTSNMTVDQPLTATKQPMTSSITSKATAVKTTVATTVKPTVKKTTLSSTTVTTATTKAPTTTSRAVRTTVTTTHTTTTTKATATTTTAVPKTMTLAEAENYANAYLESLGMEIDYTATPSNAGFMPPLTWDHGESFEQKKELIRLHIDITLESRGLTAGHPMRAVAEYRPNEWDNTYGWLYILH